MALYDPAQKVLLPFWDERFSSISPIMRPFVLLAIAVLVVKMAVWINNGSSPMPMTSFPAISFSVVGSSLLVYARSAIRSQRRARYHVYLGALPEELITLQVGGMDPDSQNEIAAWQKKQKAPNHE